jgi:hypothetical protein
MVRKFTVITNHKNLEYSTTRQLLLERHVRWADTLSMYNLTFVYRPGKVNGRADAMSRKEENTPAGEDNNPMMSREFRMLCLVTKQEFTKHKREAGASLCFSARIAFFQPVRQSNRFSCDVCRPASGTTKEPARAQDKIAPDTCSGIQPRAVIPGENGGEGDEDTSARQWAEAIGQDSIYKDAVTALERRARKFPPTTGIKVSLSECSLNEKGFLMYRDRKWVPGDAFLRTSIIAETHNSPAADHPGRENTYSILARTYFWPGMLSISGSLYRTATSAAEQSHGES